MHEHVVEIPRCVMNSIRDLCDQFGKGMPYVVELQSDDIKTTRITGFSIPEQENTVFGVRVLKPTGNHLMSVRPLLNAFFSNIDNENLKKGCSLILVAGSDKTVARDAQGEVMVKFVD